MKFRRTQQFRGDFDGLLESNKKEVEEAFPYVVLALQGNDEYHRKYRIKRMEGHPNIWEGHVKINLCFTFHHETDEDGKVIVFFTEYCVNI
jgi:mRNA-degrading endonuclease YafQ of YafQ-DinJ toxin-antitoxin module